jgi:hypothetical protein
VTFYEADNFGGRHYAICSRFDGTGGRDWPQSVIVEGGAWEICVDADLRGECRTFGPGEYASLPPELDNRISSGRRISIDYPYTNQPSWR